MNMASGARDRNDAAKVLRFSASLLIASYSDDDDVEDDEDHHDDNDMMMIFTHLKDLLNRSAFSLKKALMVVIFAN
jgi:hypothetical protein